MAKQTISLGTPPSGTDGDTNRTAFEKCNTNFDELYSGLTGLIFGLKLEWVSGTSLRVTPGSAHIPALGYAVNLPAPITKAGLVTSVNSWYHVYLYQIGAALDIEIVTTDPSAPYSGTARTKTGDVSRRYLGSVRTMPNASMAKFQHQPESGLITYYENINTTPFVVLSGGVATVATTVSCASTVPLTGKGAVLMANNNSTGQAMYMSNGLAANALSAAFWMAYIASRGSHYGHFPLDDSRAFNYLFDAAPVGGQAFARVTGYTFER